MKLNPFVKPDKSTYLPDKKLFFCTFSYTDFDDDLDEDDEEKVFENCYVLANSIEDAERLVIKECKKKNSIYFDWIECDQISNVKDSLEIEEITDINHSIDQFWGNLIPINNTKCKITMEEYFERLKAIEKKNEQFEEFDKKQLKFEFWE